VDREDRLNLGQDVYSLTKDPDEMAKIGQIRDVKKHKEELDNKAGIEAEAKKTAKATAKSGGLKGAAKATVSKSRVTGWRGCSVSQMTGIR